MEMEKVLKKINRYLKKENMGPLIVDVQSHHDLDALVTHYNLPQNTFINISDSRFCNPDEFPLISAVYDYLAKTSGTIFVREVSTFFRLKGEDAITQILSELLSINSAGYVVVLTYQCKDILHAMIQKDKRLEGRICIADGEKNELPQLVFAAKDISLQNGNTIVRGIHRMPAAVETNSSETLYVETAKTKKNYPNALYSIQEMNDPYEILCSKDHMTNLLPKAIGSEENWNDALAEFQAHPSWAQLISAKIGDVHSLEAFLSLYPQKSEDQQWQWLYFVGLKLFGVHAGGYFDAAIKKTETMAELVRNLYRTILEVSPENEQFESLYAQRKGLLNAIGNPVDEVVNFCKIVLSKEQEALYYLTDNSLQEKELVFKLLNQYGQSFEKEKLLLILERTYPDLYDYLMPYRFKNDLLDGYFQDYKYQKVINKIFPEFMEVVEQQAVSKEYITILQPRSSLIEAIDMGNAQAYFTDAMGVEYLAFIMEKCRERKLMAKVTVCRCELPSLTCRNKEFWDVLSTEEHPIITFDKIDKIKHHGEEGYDYSRADRKLPIHLIRELELIAELLDKIKVNLANGSYEKAVLVSDHGASRLAVIHETENLIEMDQNGQHSGRCCPKSEIDIKPESAADADDFWALANYDRFKGSRKANVEVHGGATLEEVVVPIIEISYLRAEIEVKLMPVDAAATFTGIPEILVSFRRKAAIKIFATQKLLDVSVQIDGHTYNAKAIDDNFYVVEAMPEIRRAKTYEVDIYACGNKIASALPLRVRKESGSEKSIL